VPDSTNWQPTATEEQESAAQRHLAAARTHADAKDLTATITELDAIIEKAPNSSLGPDAMYQKGIACNALGEHGKALDTWHELQKTYPDHRLSIRAERRIGKATYALFRQEHGEDEFWPEFHDQAGPDPRAGALCGPKCLQYVVNTLGVKASAKELARLAGARSTGTAMSGLAKAARPRCYPGGLMV